MAKELSDYGIITPVISAGDLMVRAVLNKMFIDYNGNPYKVSKADIFSNKITKQYEDGNLEVVSLKEFWRDLLIQKIPRAKESQLVETVQTQILDSAEAADVQ
jgi:hypothetical protein